MPLNELEIARQLAEGGDFDRAYILTNRHLKENPNSLDWLMVLTYIMLGTDKPIIAYHLAKRCVQLQPKHSGAYMNLGMACRDLWMDQESIRYNKRGLKLSKDPAQRSMFAVNTASVLIDTGRFKEAEEYCAIAVEDNPESIKGRANIGFCQLAQRDWADGWKNYRYCLGHEWRPRHQYNDEPDWDGVGRGNIVLYGEQGLGDQISFSSILPDAMKWAEKNDSRIIVDVSNRLETLLKRSFPGLTVYGTQGKQELHWAKEDQDIDYSLPIGQACEYFRTSDGDFPGTPYLKPDPDRLLQWEALFKSKKKPVIGIAWTGGIDKTGASFRNVGLEALLPILQSVDAHFVSLQYKPAHKAIAAFKAEHPEIDISEYKHGTLTNDYDDTVAMIAALDCFVGTHTTSMHVAGGLGIPSLAMVPTNSQWRYGQGYDDYLWCNSIQLVRQTQRGDWGDVVKKISGELSALFPKLRKTAGKAPRKGKLRRNSPQVRLNGVADHRQAGN